MSTRIEFVTELLMYLKIITILMERLTNGHLFILDEGGHGEGNLECKIEVIRSFFDNSENRPGSGCLNIIDVY